MPPVVLHRMISTLDDVHLCTIYTYKKQTTNKLNKTIQSIPKDKDIQYQPHQLITELLQLNLNFVII